MRLLAAAHPGPALAVTVLAGILALGEGAAVETTILVVAAVLTGQLSIGWSNDLIDLERDRAMGRTDKPLAGGDLSVQVVGGACALALASTVPLSLAVGWVAGALHLVGMVGGGWAYNLGAKATLWSPLPYAIGFGALPTYVLLAVEPGVVPPWWVPTAGALLGVGAHLVNVLPDLADDAATGVRGLPHRLGERWIPRAAGLLLGSASLVIVVGAGSLGVVEVGALGVVALLVAVVWTAPGRWPFYAAIGIALVGVVLLVAS